MIHRLLNRFRQLESLSLTWCKDVTDSGLVLLQKYGLQLCSIDLDSCTRITDGYIGRTVGEDEFHVFIRLLEKALQCWRYS